MYFIYFIIYKNIHQKMTRKKICKNVYSNKI